ncbi:hypothetical protein [Oceanithermus sp.]
MLEVFYDRPTWDDHPVTLIENEPLGPHHRLVLEAPTLETVRPGQFVNLSVPGHVLRRPLAPVRQEGGLIELIVTPFGPGTRELVGLRPKPGCRCWPRSETPSRLPGARPSWSAPAQARPRWPAWPRRSLWPGGR